jgi:Flp pilus assembly protein TadG
MTATSRASPTRRHTPDASDRGMVTVEAAVSLCAFVTVLAMVLAGMSMVLAQIRCTDAAREAARLVARGEADRAADAVGQIAPHAVLSVSTHGDGIHVTVQDPDAAGLLPGVHVAADAFAVQEPDADDSEPGPPASTGPPGDSGDPDGGPDRLSRPAGGDRR